MADFPRRSSRALLALAAALGAPHPLQGQSTGTPPSPPQADAKAKAELAKAIPWAAPVQLDASMFAPGKLPPPPPGADGLLYASFSLTGEGVARQWPEADGWKLITRQLAAPGTGQVTLSVVDGRDATRPLGTFAIPLEKGIANVVFAFQSRVDPASKELRASLGAWAVTPTTLQSLGSAIVPATALRDRSGGDPPYREPGTLLGAVGATQDIVAAWSWNGPDAEPYLQVARGRDRGEGMEFEGLTAAQARFAQQPLSKWPGSVLLVIASAPAKPGR